MSFSSLLQLRVSKLCMFPPLAKSIQAKDLHSLTTCYKLASPSYSRLASKMLIPWHCDAA